MTNVATPSNTIDLRLPQLPDTTDPELFRQLLIVYTALRQLQNGTDKYLDVPGVPVSASRSIDYLDRGQALECLTPEVSAITVPNEDTLGYEFPLGTTISIINVGNVNLSITPASGVTLVLSGTNTTGTRTVANWGCATIRRLVKNNWIVLGAGVS
jgi:hypothetical protein